MTTRFFSFLAVFIAIFFSQKTALSQSDVKLFTKSITDTTKSQYEQARDIYNWITHTISYDLKAFEKQEMSNLSVEEIMKKKKGICSDFSRLYCAMCNSVGIEAYSISGYVKGFGYVERSPFLRTRHSWNVINTDSTWIFADATWGSGKIMAKPATIDMLKYYILRMPYANSKIYYLPIPDSTYFDISLDSLAKTHYPLDPKWFFTKFPLNFYNFESDSLPKTTTYLDYQTQISGLKNKDEYSVYKLDAINGIKYNAHNYFDLAYSYYLFSQTYDLERSIRENNLSQYEGYCNDFDLINKSIMRYKAITDSVYKQRTSSLKKLAGDQKRLSGKIQSKAKAAERSYRSDQKVLLGKNSTYKTKLSAMTINVGRAELKKIPGGTYSDSIGINKTEFALLSTQADELHSQEEPILFSLDSLLKEVDRQMLNGVSLDDTIDKKNQKLNKNIIEYYDMVLTGQEPIICKYVDTLKTIHSEILTSFGQKKIMKSEMQETSKVYNKKTADLQKLLNQEMALYKKSIKPSPNRDSLIAIHNAAVNRLIESYKNSMKLMQRISNYTTDQKELNKQNLTEIKTQRKNIKKASAFFTKWYNSITESEKFVYEKDKELIKTIQSESMRNKKMLQMKIDKYKQEIEKAKVEKK